MMTKKLLLLVSFVEMPSDVRAAFKIGLLHVLHSGSRTTVLIVECLSVL